MNLFCEWLDIDRRGLQFILDEHRNPRYWQQPAPGRFEPTPALDAALAAIPDAPDTDAACSRMGLHAHRTLEGPEGRRYITVGKGYPS